ncbi:MAG: hypothetical protein M1817_005814 [Caeruleum heppii]|nr:MAG: hypothetical protein M1817_005814 [Caeruleum heppii]
MPWTVRRLFNARHLDPGRNRLFRRAQERRVKSMSITATATATLTATVSETPVRGAVPEGAAEKRHHLKNGKGFANPWESWRNMGVIEILGAFAKRRFSGDFNNPDTTPPTIPVRKPTFLPSRETPNLRATWLGHACYYVEFPGGFRVLFDPVFEDRCSPFSFMGPKRYTPAPCQVNEIPLIDAVVISHSHYDHLSHPTVVALQKSHPDIHFFVPLRLKQWFLESGLKNVTELDWWEEKDIRLSGKKSDAGGEKDEDITATISCLPCQHTSARSLTDKSATLWASWGVRSGGKSIWFGGDTGYRAVPQLPPDVDDYGPGHEYPHCPAFGEIGKSRGPFDLGLIPIGAYNPRWIMSPMHANPFDSVNIFVDTRCKRAMGIHWGTWVLTEENVLEPPQLLRKALAQHNLPEQGVFDVCDIGESREF